MLSYFKNIKGDKAIWGIVALLALFSFLPVYSASSNLVYVVGNGTAVSHLIKHAFLLLLGFGIIYGVHKIPMHFFKGLSIIAMPIVLLLLGYTLAQGKTIGGANASRWINIPFVGFSFQTSTLAAVVLMIYVARYLAKIKNKVVTFKESILPLWLPVFLVVVLILPANFSTAAIIFFMVLTLTFLGGYPFKYLLGIVGTGIACLALFILIAKAVPDLFDNRIDTWENRIANFFNGEDTSEDYQIERAKIAIASGGVLGKGSGKSVQKNFLPQSSSDFIYAIIVEEYGLVGGLVVMFFYLLLLFRIVVVANANPSVFGKLLVVGVGLPIVFQAFINMAVAVELFPVTGQTLPLISSGGTSIWMTCLAIGIVLSASNKNPVKEKKVVDESNPLDVLSEQL
ncbi:MULTISPECIES: FtsW/RodA/SpoVE family cell cycle protein [Cellulophaga]|uniref:Probable peptidoglycan glycosyltransferase FtsW n=1 Tax=Cellulophaga lytica (strain ATCC 23178 / DSM 7489 / JCM 8516 / NBRC 14961 / NCIMB 1423 / VKM B-1433 / Cy l20) TaxID=867900 RepID=F0RDT2_CELLC|nr:MULTISPECIES: FtsW/RodA/SpoVE family cell cycle protein [Cellulophaga]ADY29843.1 cell cycle protein [Cellulophaga lytica DSM 7489]AIM60842.1 cell division protein FtsW [Cellulophaga lytica]MDO6854547.1 FtsW/RodA/SpoVE family cell cycle protein [Cellulophaga lytica]TVZ07608.1 cell division protein FtsW [Cellulophaga sp. RHA_52]WQG75991.1 FtsW/RodA/SpoVE family cell cycle protein [Cellulophaga lytica]